MPACISRSRTRVVRVARAFIASAALVGAIVPAQDLPSSPQDYLRRMDTDGDGRVSRAEYVAWMMRNFDALDADGNGVLEGDELPPGARPVARADYVRSLEAAFARQDANHDGFLDSRELARPPR